MRLFWQHLTPIHEAKMSESVPPIEAPPPIKSVIEPDPVLGAYIAHHPSNRLLLLILGGMAYAIPVFLLQILFSQADKSTAAVVLISAYSIIALIIGWIILHLWNREVILYERGFTYREGSKIRAFPYASIVSFQQRSTRFALLSRWPIVVYRTTMTTDQDEVLLINNVYTQTEKLVRRLEGLITRARLPVVASKFHAGERVSFGPLSLSGQALHVGDKTLLWSDWEGYRFANNQLVLTDKSGADWASVPVLEIDQILLVVGLLKATIEQRQSPNRNGTH
jgi:hypothetical protein